MTFDPEHKFFLCFSKPIYPSILLLNNLFLVCLCDYGNDILLKRQITFEKAVPFMYYLIRFFL